jgi:NAD(P)-dependent dehydrogenase (short-subunit alcohol dehydrogenase family)
MLAARDRARGDAAVRALRDEGVVAEAMTLDVASDDSVRAFMAELESRQRPAAGNLVRVDVLVNNAGAIVERGHSRTAEVTAATVAESLNNNTLGAYRLLQAILPLMNRHGYGRVVNVSSGMGGITEMSGGWPAYRISKAALNAVTRVFAAEAAGDNVKINSVCPGWVRTDMGGAGATRSVEEGASGIVWAATLPSDGPSGGFFRDGRAIAF